MHLPGPIGHVKAGRLAAAAVLALLGTTFAYLTLAVPQRWFGSEAPIAYSAERIAIARGVAVAGEHGDVLVRPRDGERAVLMSVETDFASDRYPGVAWSALDIPEGATVRLLWRTDVAPQRLSEVRVPVEAGRPGLAMLANHQEWVGRVKGVALFIEPVAGSPIRLQRLVMKPLTASNVLADRMDEWLALETWTGTSLNGIAGGADVQALPLPLFAATTAAVAWLLWWVMAGRPDRRAGGAAALILFACTWILLDIRWTWNLARQVAQTAARFQGLDVREKHLADSDGALFGFVDRALAELPATPTRVFVAAEAPYFRARAAWHLYPHNAYYDTTRDVLPPAGDMRPGDWILVWRRRGIQYDPAQRLLRWDNGAPVRAALRARAEGSALFEVEP